MQEVTLKNGDVLVKFKGLWFKVVSDPLNILGCEKCTMNDDNFGSCEAEYCVANGCYFVEVGEEPKPVNKYRRVRL